MNDAARAYTIVRMLGGKSGLAPPPTHTKNEDGALTKSPKEREETWHRHFKEVFGGEIKTLKDTSLAACSTPHESPIHYDGRDDTRAAIGRLKNNKGVDPDSPPGAFRNAGATRRWTSCIQYTSR